jgi:hypothetical protein
MAMVHQQRPAIMLGSKRKHPAWFVFPLAHELAHVLRRHVKPGDRPLADERLNLDQQDDTDGAEEEANRFALAVMVGDEPPVFGHPFKYVSDLQAVLQARAGEFGTTPGVLALMYGKATGGWPHAQAIVNRLEGQTARSILSAPIRGKIPSEELTEDSSRFLHAVSAIAA